MFQAARTKFELLLALCFSPISSKVSPVSHDSSAKFFFFFCSMTCEVRDEMAPLKTKQSKK